jgi:hypothetical protein
LTFIVVEHDNKKLCVILCENGGKMVGKWWENGGKMVGKWENRKHCKIVTFDGFFGSFLLCSVGEA